MNTKGNTCSNNKSLIDIFWVGQLIDNNSVEISLHSISENITQSNQWKHFSEYCKVNIPHPIFCLCTKNSIIKVYHIGPTDKRFEFERSNRFFSFVYLACQYRVLSKRQLQSISTLHIFRWDTIWAREKGWKMSENGMSLFALRKKKKSNKRLSRAFKGGTGKELLYSSKSILMRAPVKSLTAADLPRFPKNQG